MKSAVSWDRQKGGGTEGESWAEGRRQLPLLGQSWPAEPPAAPGWCEGSPTPAVSAGQACRLERVRLCGRGGKEPPPGTQEGRDPSSLEGEPVWLPTSKSAWSGVRVWLRRGGPDPGVSSPMSWTCRLLWAGVCVEVIRSAGGARW